MKYKTHHLHRRSTNSNLARLSLELLVVSFGLMVLIGIVFTILDEFL